MFESPSYLVSVFLSFFQSHMNFASVWFLLCTDWIEKDIDYICRVARANCIVQGRSAT